MGDRDRAMGDENQRGRLYALIAAQGGVYAKESIELWERHEGKGAGPSVGFLLDDPFFVISHPGMTSCLDDNGALVNAKVIRERLRNADGLQIYLKLRRSGFAPLDFPAWDERMLDMWSEWAEESVAHDVSSEIVARLQRDGVTCNGIRRGDTNAMDTCDDFGLLDSPRRPADSTIPAAEDIFQLVATAQRFGFLNWYLVNCCTGRHWYSHRAISWLAFLVACGALEACGHWQERHGLTTTGRSMLRALVGCARQHESLTWSANESCQRIIERCADTWQQNIEGSWVSRVEFSRLLSAMLDPIRREGPATLNADVFKLSTSRSLLPRKSSAHASQYVDPFLRDLLG